MRGQDRIDRLERLAGIEAGSPQERVAVFMPDNGRDLTKPGDAILYDPAELPDDPEERQEWIDRHWPPDNRNIALFMARE